MKPSYEQLEDQLIKTRDELASTKVALAKTQAILKMALERITKLEEKQNKNSNNSSKPPSSDQKGNTPDKEKKKRKSRKGKSRAPYPPERVDHHIQCSRECCPHCHTNQLQELEDAPFEWQQVELPEIRAIVTQFNCLKYFCKECGKRSIADLPLGVPFSAFGPKLMALVANFDRSVSYSQA